MAQPDDLGRAAADIEYDRVRKPGVQQRRAAGHDQPRLLGGRDDPDLDPDLVANAGQKPAAVPGAPARLGRALAGHRYLAPAHLAGPAPPPLARAAPSRVGPPAPRRG